MRRLVAVAAALAGLALSASPAAAVSGPSITEAKSARFPDRTWVLTLPERAGLTASDVEIRENGRRVEELEVVAGDAAGRKAFGVVLAIDASQSMRGEPIADAVAAAREFASRRRPDQQLGLVYFSRTARVALPLTTDAKKIEQALATPPALSKGTRIYDASNVGIGLLRDADIQAGSVIVLSDGADVGSTTSSSQLAAEARRSGARIYAVGLKSPSYDARTLQDVAVRNRGTYAEAGSARQLKAIYGTLGEQLSSEYLVHYRSLAAAGADVSVEARIDGITQSAVARYTAPDLGLPAATAPPREPRGWGSPLAVAIAAALVALLLALAAWLLVRGPQVTVQDRIAAYVSPRPESISPFAQEPGGGLLSTLMERFLTRAGWWPRYREAVELSGIAISPARLAILTLAGTLALMWLAIASGRGLAAVILAFTPIVSYLVLRSRIEKVRRAFADQLMDNLQIVASAMRAGYSFEGGLAVAAEDASEPMRSELRRIVSDERLGVPLQVAMAETARRMDSREFEHVALVVMSQREAGGNIAELLDRAVESLRHRGELRRMVRSLTAQGRAGGLVVTAMPPAMALLLSVISPGFFDPMIQEPVGRMLFVVAGLMVGVGWLIIRRIVDIRV